MITVATVLYKATSQTPPWSRCYSEAWVDRLYRGVARNYQNEFKFVCLTDKHYEFSEDIQIQPLQHTRWATACLQLHAVKADRLVLMGLDTIIVGDLTELFAYRGALAIPRDPYRPQNPCNAVVLSTTREDIAESNATSDMNALELFEHEYLDDLFPGQVLSYKAHVRDGNGDALPEGVRIIYFHGEPKPHLLTDRKWIQENWK